MIFIACKDTYFPSNAHKSAYKFFTRFSHPSISIVPKREIMTSPNVGELKQPYPDKQPYSQIS